MNNLHRDLAPMSAAAWADLTDEATRTLTRHLAGRRVVDVVDPAGPTFAAVSTGRRADLASPWPGVATQRRQVAPVIELKVPFTVRRSEIDDVERGATDADWQPVKDAARQLALAEDSLIVDGLEAAGIAGIRSKAPTTVALPDDPRQYVAAVAQASTVLRLAGVQGPYALLLSADIYTEVAETVDHGYPLLDHLTRVLGGGKIIWAPAITGALMVSMRGGDYELLLGQDTSIGYLRHDAETVELYFIESLAFRVNSDEAAVPIG